MIFFNRFMLSEYSEIYSMDWLLTGRGGMYLLKDRHQQWELGEKTFYSKLLKVPTNK